MQCLRSNTRVTTLFHFALSTVENNPLSLLAERILNIVLGLCMYNASHNS